MTNHRFDYLDIARGIGILMVVWAHILVTGWTHEMIYAFHMPLFFFLSGMLFKREKYNSFYSFLIHRGKRLFVPYIIYSVVTWLFWASFRYIRHDEVESYMMPLLQTFIAQGSGAFMVHNSALWFIPCLFLTEIMYFFISRLGYIGSIVASFCLAGLSFLFGHLYGDGYWFLLPWNADAALIALPFYAVGNVLIKNISHEKLNKLVAARCDITIITVVCLTVIFYFSATLFGECSMGSSSYNCNGIIFMLRAFLGCAWIIIISLLLGNITSNFNISKVIINYLKWAGRKSLDIMCIHIPLKGICMILVAYLLHTSVSCVSENLPYSSLSFIITMIACWFIIRFITDNITKISSKQSK